MKDKQSSISFINHDIRNNIAASLSFIDLLSLKFPDMENSKCVCYMRFALSRAVELTQDISDICSMEGRQDDFYGTTLDVLPIHKFWLDKTKQCYEELRSIFSIDIVDEYILLDEDKHLAVNLDAIRRARENIILNAVHAGATRIDITYEMQAHCAVVTFQDNGRGMSQADIDNIMLSQQGDGVIHGLGTRSILTTAKEHGFHLKYTSEINEGTTLRLLCPYVKL